MLAQCYIRTMILLWCGSQVILAEKEPTKIYDLVDEEIVIPQWIEKDAYDTSREASKIDQAFIRYPHHEQRYRRTNVNQELVILSTEENRLVPSGRELLEINKSPKKFFPRVDFAPTFASGVNARHRFAEGLQLRLDSIHSTDETIIPFLFFPTGWPIFLLVLFALSVFICPVIGCILVHAGFSVAFYYRIFLWSPIKTIIRWILIKWQVYNQRWRRYLAPSHFIETRITWKIPYLLRNEKLEDIPPEVAYVPPINKIDYTMYILSPEDYDEYDLETDEIEFIDELLQFRDDNPKLVARLLKYRLGDDKFYHYFEEDILSSESEEEALPPPLAPVPEATVTPPVDESAQRAADLAAYLAAVQAEDPWLREDFDKTFKGTATDLEEIQQRRAIIRDLQEELKYLHTLIDAGSKYTENMEELSEEKKAKLQGQARKVMDRYLKFSTRTKERIEELEPSERIQKVHNLTLSKYLPLIGDMSHYNHQLNLKHEKMKDSKRRKLQLEAFGGP